MQEKDEKLFELNKIFNRIEPYDDKENVGFRSLNNSAIFLLLYAISDDKQQVLFDLAEKANMHSKENIEALKTLVEDLARPEVIRLCIADYERANGQFSIEVSGQNVAKIEAAVNQLDRTGKLAGYVRGSDEIAGDTFVLKMNNTIKFKWEPNKLRETEEVFRGQKIGYLEARDRDHRFKYRLAKIEGKSYNTVAFGVSDITKGEKPATAYFIEPVDQADLHPLRNEYYPLLEKAKNSEFTLADYRELEALRLDSVRCEQYQSRREVSHEESLKESSKIPTYSFSFVFKLPRLQEKLVTQEQRLGIYSIFNLKTIAQIPMHLKYQGTRGVYYDKDGGVIENTETVTMRAGCAFSQQPAERYYRPHIHVTITYTIRNPFMFIFQNEDCYPAIISDPNTNLAKEFKGVYQECQEREDPSFSQILNRFKFFQAVVDEDGKKESADTGCALF